MATHLNGDSPPAFEPVNNIELSSIKDSKIVKVSVYSSRAEVTRHCKFTVSTGQNLVQINGLPDVLEAQSLRVEGRGNATIHDVVLSSMPRPPMTSTSAKLVDLQSKRDQLQKALGRAKKALESLENYLSTMNIQHVDSSNLTAVVDNYDSAAEKLDDRVLTLEKELKDTEDAIRAEQQVLLSPPEAHSLLKQRVSVGVFAGAGGEVELTLIYAVNRASWYAGYDVRVNMQTKETPVTLIYKANIKQATGEVSDIMPLLPISYSAVLGGHPAHPRDRHADLWCWCSHPQPLDTIHAQAQSTTTGIHDAWSESKRRTHVPQEICLYRKRRGHGI